MKCPKCQFENPEGFEFCGKCGQSFKEAAEVEKKIPEAGAERKHVTVLFSDLSGYTAMSERLDPEEVKDITTKLFNEITQVIDKYDGFIEKFVGDAVMALFGVPKAHEDDPVRAILAAREIHFLADSESPELEERIGHPFSMHTGINTGLVVTGEVDMAKGTHGVSGDTINLAARLSSLSKPGDIVVGPDTYRQAQGYFAFENLGSAEFKGKTEPIEVYKVLSPKEKPSKIHHPLGLRSELIGRKREMAQLGEAVERLQKAKSSILSVCGDAGTGKSRLIEEFKATLDLDKIQWREGHAYAYSQNIPHFPLIDLLNRAFEIEEGDPPERVRQKVESNVVDLVGKKEGVVPYVGGLFSLSYPEAEDASPEFWKARLHEAVISIFSALAQRAPTIICLEDLHWADHSSLELLRSMFSELESAVLFLCVYRPPFSLLSKDQIGNGNTSYQEIRLQDLSGLETQDMVASLLSAESIPPELERFVQEKVEGNPFYLEEVINNLIDSETLVRDNGNWKLLRPILDSEIPSTIHGVISARLDRLEKEMKRILQEASVIGRVFLYEILRRVTEIEDQMDHCLSSLKDLDLIRIRSLQPDLEYIFKHALTQEAVYSGLLKKERRAIHEQIGLVMEQLFHDRLPEFYETLAIHFVEGQSQLKAVDYLMKSGEKSLKRYALEESHRYFRQGYDILRNKISKTERELEILIDLINKWASVFYFSGDVNGLMVLLREHEREAELIADGAKRGMFYAWLGWALGMQEKVNDSFKYLYRALEIGEKTGDQLIIGYACTWLIFTCAEGMFEKGITFGEKAYEIARVIECDQYLFFKSLCGMGHICYWKGERERTREIGKLLLDYGKSHSNIRCLTVGHVCMGYYHLAAGIFSSAIECFQKAIQVSEDPIYSHWARVFLGTTYLQNEEFSEAEKALQEVVFYSDSFGCGILGTFAEALLGVVSIGEGKMSSGMKMLQEAREKSLQNNRTLVYALSEYLLAKVYFQMAAGGRPMGLLTLAKNFGFLLRNAPSAGKKAEKHFNKAIEVATQIGAKGLLGQGYLDLGLLHKSKKRKEQARKCFSEAIRIFQETEAENYLGEAKEALASLG